MWEVYPVAGTAALFTPSLGRALSWLSFRGGFGGCFLNCLLFQRVLWGFFFFLFFLSFFFDSPLVSQMDLRLDCFHFDEAAGRGGLFLFTISCWSSLPPSAPILSASVSLFPVCLEACFSGTRTLSPSACSVPGPMWLPFHLCIYDIPKTLNTGAGGENWNVHLSGSTSASFTSILYHFGQVIGSSLLPFPYLWHRDRTSVLQLCFQTYRRKIFARAEHCFIQIKWKHTCLGPDPSLSHGSILWLLALTLKNETWWTVVHNEGPGS